ncbi:DUF4230 domain-containing protein [Leptolyngbya cf. ectocarpi LEGE 11479]|uniref:DUF4230 domain-containing protein n=1 Tax=Leptolyngbya cf. ectocarpi LEGE 11479 TaxID=1828722 RepID=A0A928X383_LEPEC|nr:DUF4230 domain-containing protein [Leptolyngbya ectocarpi]MBE9066243.1 DUF4230 domain-containing protein [Leptolyngbya cf. ectocarpi LEGE 11479]
MFTRPSRIANRSRSRKTDKQKEKQINQPSRRSEPLPVWSMLSMAVLGGGLVVASIAGYGMWRTGEQFMEGVKLMFTPQPPEDKVDTRTLVIQQVQGASELTTAIFAMEAVVPTESNRTVGSYVVGQTNLLYIAHGEVRAGIDLEAISEENVRVIDGAEDQPPSLVVTLPAPKILDSKLDVTRSKVYEYDRGFLNLGPDRAPELQTLAQQEALKQIRQGACDEGILSMASERAEVTMHQLLAPMGYGNLTVNVTEPKGCS